MKFYYFFNFTNDLNNGIGKKVLGQCIYLYKSGLDLNLFLFGDHEIEETNLGFIKETRIFRALPSFYLNVFLRIRRQYELRKALMNLIESASSSDIIYMRYPYPLFYLLWPFSRKGRICKIVSEHNTIEFKEFWLIGSHLILFVDLLVGNLVRRKADGIVGVTDEITSHEVKRSGDLNKPHIIIGNGVEVNKIKIRKPPNFNGDKLKLLCVASVSRWHGLDRLLRGLAAYRGDTEVHIHIVGDGKELQNLKDLTRKYGLAEKIFFHGFLDGKELDEMFDHCHLAIGSMGLHRKGLKQTSELKIREYAARGIPFFCSAVDADFPEDYPYFLKISEGDYPVDLEEVVRFAEKVYLDPEHNLKMRTHAEEKLDWSVKMKKLKEFCETLVERPDRHNKDLQQELALPN